MSNNFYDISNVSTFEVCFLTSLLSNIPKEKRKNVFDIDHSSVKNNLWKGMLCDKIFNKLDFNKLIRFIEMCNESLELNLIKSMINTGLLKKICEKYHDFNVILTLGLINHSRFYDYKSSKILKAWRLPKRHPELAKLRIAIYMFVENLPFKVSELEELAFLAHGHLRGIICFKVVKETWKITGMKSAIIQVKHQSQFGLRLKGLKAYKQYVKKYGKDPTSWSPEIHSICRLYVKQTILTLLMINKLRPKSGLYQLPNELMHILYKKI